MIDSEQKNQNISQEKFFTLSEFRQELGIPLILAKKLVVWGEDRNLAADKLNLALNEVVFLGVKTNRDYLKRILTLAEYREGKTFTHFVHTYAEKLKPKKRSNEDIALAIAAALLSKNDKSQNSHDSVTRSLNVWESLTGFRNI